MKYYKGKIDGIDVPENGGADVNIYNDANEEYNFITEYLEEYKEFFCLGYVRPSTPSKNTTSQIHLEKINGCELFKNKESVSGITVVWCAKSKKIDGTRVVGWYKDATVYRNPQYLYDKYEYRVKDKKENCVLLPERERFLSKWIVPRKGHNRYDFGFGQSNVWFAQDQETERGLKQYLEKLLSQIENYNGENWIDKEAE